MMLKKTISFEISHLNSLLDSENSCVSVVRGFKSKLSLYPFHLGYLKHAVRELLDNKVSKYSPELNGIILGHSNVKVINSLDYRDNNRIFLSYIADIYLFTPAVGKVLTGVVNKKSKEHIGCLIHNAFNASIPKPREPGQDLSIWLRTNNSIQIGHNLEFTVAKADFSSKVPYIQGIIVRTEGDYKEEEVDSAFCDDEEMVKIKKKKKRKSKETEENIKQEPEDSTSYHDPAQIAHLMNDDETPVKIKRRKSEIFDLEGSDILTPPEKKKIKKEKVSIVINGNEDALTPNQIKTENFDEFLTPSRIKKESSPSLSKKSKRNSLEKSIKVKKEPNVEELTASLLKEAMDNCFSPLNDPHQKKKRKSKTYDNEANETPKSSKLSEKYSTPSSNPLSEKEIDSDSVKKKKKSKTNSSESTPKSSKSPTKEIVSSLAASEDLGSVNEKSAKKRKRSESPMKGDLDDSLSFKHKKKKSRKSSLDDLTNSMLEDALAKIK